MILLACLMVVALASLSLKWSYDQTRLRAEDSVRDLCNILGENLVSSYEKIDLALLGVKDLVEQRLESREMSISQMEESIKHQRERVPLLVALKTVDAEGKEEFGIDVSKGVPIDIGDREGFLRLKADPAAGLVISQPCMGKKIPGWIISFSRRINRPDGSFAGAVYGWIEQQKLTSLFAAQSIGKEGAVTLRDAKLTVIARFGRGEDKTGFSGASPEFQTLLKSGSTSGCYQAVAAIDNLERIFAFQQLGRFGQILHVGVGVREIFAHWTVEMYKTIGVVVSFFLFMGMMSRIALVAWRRQQSAEADRERMIVELRTALADVKTLRGFLPICCSCKKIRDDRGYWNQIEAYISNHSEAVFSHSICPSCSKKLYPEFFDPANEKNGE